MKILDACCGSRMFWFDKQTPGVIFSDNRKERHMLKDKLSKRGYRELKIKPDIQADFKALPFKSNHFKLVVFDPPHLVYCGQKGWLAKKYGKLTPRWTDDLKKGFLECFRVLCPEGILIFKWSEYDISISQVLSLFPIRPLFGSRGKSKTHWIVFIKATR